MKLSGYSLAAEKMVTHGLSGTCLVVRDDLEAHPARHLPEVRVLISSSSLSDRLKATTLAVFERLARAEAGIHGVPVERVRFHEIGAVDSLVDIAGFAAGLGLLGVQHVHCSPVPLGSGAIQTAHGLLAELASFSTPPLTLRAVGYGIGAKELPWANVVRAFLGDAAAASDAGTMVLIECNIDDSTGEELGFAMESLLAAGALDVWFVPIQMKKNRPVVQLAMLARPSEATALAAAVLRETSTLGVRISPPLSRLVCDREVREAATPWGAVRIKVKLLNGIELSIAPEYEDCARIAREQGIPLRQVMEAAREASKK